MPKKIRRKKVVSKKAVQTKTAKEQSVKWSESYTSLLLGTIVVIIAVLFFGSLLKLKHTKDVTSTSTTLAPQEIQQNFGKDQQTTYTVQPGDDLWHIAVKMYNNGYAWTEIAKANNITSPGLIYKGDILIIPKLKDEQQILSNKNNEQNFPEQQNSSTEAITGTSYTVKQGDNLWAIAVRAYADGYKWTDIAKANQLANPGIIHPGNVFKIPR